MKEWNVWNMERFSNSLAIAKNSKKNYKTSSTKNFSSPPSNQPRVTRESYSRSPWCEMLISKLSLRSERYGRVRNQMTREWKVSFAAWQTAKINQLRKFLPPPERSKMNWTGEKLFQQACWEPLSDYARIVIRTISHSRRVTLTSQFD